MDQAIKATIFAAVVCFQEIAVRRLIEATPYVSLLPLLITSFIATVVNIINKGEDTETNFKIAGLVGLFSFIESICMIYCIDSNRTPLTAQFILLSCQIVPASVIRIWYLNKKPEEWIPTIGGIICVIVLITTISVALNDELSSYNGMISLFWIQLMFGIIVLSSFTTTLIDDKLHLVSMSLLFKWILMLVTFPLLLWFDEFNVELSYEFWILLLLYCGSLCITYMLSINMDYEAKFCALVPTGFVLLSYYWFLNKGSIVLFFAAILPCAVTATVGGIVGTFS